MRELLDDPGDSLWGSPAPVIDRLPNDPAPLSDSPAQNRALQDFATAATGWSGEPIRLSLAATVWLWGLLLAGLLVSAWLIGVHRGSMTCSGPFCTAATLGGHPVLTLVLAGLGSTVLAGMGVLTRGFSRGSMATLIATCVAAVAVLISVVGAIAVVVVLTLLAMVLLSALLLVLLTMATGA